MSVMAILVILVALFELTMASSFLLSSSAVVLLNTCWSRSQASAYASLAPSRFWALSSWTAVFAFCRARDSMAFCEGPFALFGFSVSWPLLLELRRLECLLEALLSRG